MSYILVQNFKEGLDVRKSKITAPAGTLRKAENVHITRGGEIEKCKAFPVAYELPAGTYGMHTTTTTLYVFGSGTNPGVPSGVTYQQLSAPGTPDMVEVISSESYNGVPYVVARYDDGNVYHFYNGVRVTAWDTISPTITDLDTLGTALAALVDQFSGVSATYNTGTNKVIITGDVDNVAFVCNAITINKGVDGTNSMSVATAQVADPSNPQITEVTLSGVYEAADLWQITVRLDQTDAIDQTAIISGAASGVGGPLLTYGGKMYTTTQSLLYFSDIADPTVWSGGGAGFINMSNQDGGSETLTALAPYQGYVAVFARHTTQIWFLDPDPINNRLVQILGNFGTMAARSAVNFGELDVFFLSDTGIRSVRARDASSNALVYDVGTAIDKLVIDQMMATSESTVARAVGVIEPREGRYMLAIGDTIFVLSSFPASSINAWTTYKPGFSVSEFASQGTRLYARSGDTIYLYGGTDGETYDGTVPDVELAWLDGSKPATKKKWKALDLACEGLWQVSANYDPRVDAYLPLGSTVGETYSLPSWGIQGESTHIGLKLVGNPEFEGYANLSSIAAHCDFGSQS